MPIIQSEVSQKEKQNEKKMQHDAGDDIPLISVQSIMIYICLVYK